MITTEVTSSSDDASTSSAEYAPVLEILSAQLEITAKHVEDSVSQVCQSFASIARRTKDNAAQSSQASDQSDGDALATARTTISGLLGRMDQVQRAADESVETLRRIEAIATRVDGIQLSLGEVDAVAQSLWILALNAKIEAARAGDRGQAFGIVASETGELAKGIRATSKSVRSMVDELWQEVKNSTKRMRESLIKDQMTGDLSQAADLSREEGNRALDALSRAHTDMQGQVAAAAENSQRIAEDMEDAMTALQFQDSVNQQIEHIVSALSEVSSALITGESGMADDLLERMRARSTMKAERLLLGQSHDGNDSAASSIELF